MEQFILRPEIASEMFLLISVISTLVLFFGIGYMVLVSFSIIGGFSNKWMKIGYLFWALQLYCLYDLLIKLQSKLFIPYLHFGFINNFEK
jgi:hypothetical protein